MNYPPRILTETWLFLAYSIQPECEVAKLKAMNNIIRVFGSIVVAEKYLESFEHGKSLKSA